MGTLRDAMYGLAVGDALGVPWEFMSRGSFEADGMTGYGTHNRPVGTWSDDTAMALATCDSIRRCGGIDVDDMRERFRNWLYEGAYAIDGKVFDVGNTTADALRQGRGCDGEYDNGNGSLMRIAPLAFTDATDDEIRAVSAITHAHQISCDACVAFVHVLRDMLADPAGTRERLVGEYAQIAEDEIGSSGFVRDTYQASQWCFATTDSYRDCVLRAVNLGSDTDTTAAVAGALAGTYWGRDEIPLSWLQDLRGADIIEACLF